MAIHEVVMPRMGESIREGTLTRWHKKPGDKIQREEVLFEISTDKVDSEIPSPVTGVVVRLLANEGDTVQIDTVVAMIDDAANATISAPSATPHDVKTPPVATTAQQPATSPSQSASSEAAERVIASPLARKVAEEHSVDLSSVKGTGENNRIVSRDILAKIGSHEGEKASSVPSSLVASAAAAMTAPAATASSTHMKQTGGTAEGLIDGVRVSRVPMSGMRKKIAEHMVMSKRTSPHVTSVIEIDLQKIVDLRAKFKDKFEAANGFKLTFMPFFLHAVVEAIKAVPVVNASVDGDSILYKKDINLGCAVALDWGLIVPVIKQASEKSFVGLGRELNNLAERARNKKLSPEDVRGGTFSITNFGGFGTVIGQPIINQPQVAIFGIGAMQKKPVVINDAIAIRTMCFCVLSFDHRIIDGSDSGKFLSTVKNVLENWNLPIL